MTAGNAENDAIVAFLEDLAADRRARHLRQRLAARTQQEPEKVLLYLSTLPRETIEKDVLLRMLRAIATRALAEKKTIKLMP